MKGIFAATPRRREQKAGMVDAVAPRNGLSLRARLATSAAVGALMLAAPGAALAQIVPPAAPCDDVSGTTVTCSGNLAAGVSITNNPPIFDTLNVSTMTLISPASGKDGILFTSGKNITVNSTASITVSGAGANGIEARTAFGGSGRPGGNVVIDSTGTVISGSGRGIYASASSNSVLNTFFAKVTNKGNVTALKEGIYAKSLAGTVTVDSTGNITSQDDAGIKARTSNEGKYAINVNNVGDIEAASYGIVASTNGSIVINSTGKITTDGALNDGDGILAKTSADKTNPVTSVNDITITNTGDIQASVRGSGIRTYSTYAASANISVTHVSGTITGGDDEATDDGAAISVSSSVKRLNDTIDETETITATVTTSGILKGGGTAGTGIKFTLYSYNAGAKMNGTVVITSSGRVEGGSGIDGTAIRSYAYACYSPGGDCQEYASASADVTVENSGTVTGSVRLSYTGTNIFDNKSSGLFNMGSLVYLGDGNELRNAGTLSPGGKDAVATVKVTGDLVQQAGGTMLIDVDHTNNKADRIDVTGKATLAGTVTVNELNPVIASRQFTILTAGDGVTNDGLTLADGTPVIYWLDVNPFDVVLNVEFDLAFDEQGLNRNQTALGQNLNGIFELGSGGVLPVIQGLGNITDLAEYRDALNQLLPEHYLNLQAATLFSAEDFAQSLMSCREREGAYALIAEGQCLWVEADASRLDQDGTKEQVRTEEDSYRFAAGGQFGFSEQWHMGFALRYETLEQDTGNFASSDGQRFHAGAALKFNEGPLLLAGAVSAGRTWYDTERDFNFGGFADSASSSHEVDYVNGLLRAAYLLPLGDFYLKPIADLNVTHVSSDGFTEDDGGGAALDVDDADGTHVSFSPALEAGAEWRLASGTLLRPFIGGGVTWYGDNAFTGSASFADGPEDVGSFETRTEIDEVMANVAAGIDILGVNGFDLRLRYEGAFGETVTSQSLALRAAMKF